MRTDAKRFGKGTISHKNVYLDSTPVPEGYLRIVKGITLCNTHKDPLPVTISFAESEVIYNYMIDGIGDENTITIPFMDQVLVGGERIKGHSKYIIIETGIATDGTPTTLTNNSKIYDKFQFTPDYFIRIQDPQFRTIVSNTATTATISEAWATLPSKYNYFEMYKPGTSTSTTQTTLTDLTQIWNLNMWAGFKIRTISDKGDEQIRTIISNTSNAITIDNGWEAIAPPEQITAYEIFKPGFVTDSGELTISDAEQNWSVNQFATFTVRIFEEQIRQIESHTDKTFTVSEPWDQAPSNGSRYEIFKNWINYMISGREIEIHN